MAGGVWECGRSEMCVGVGLYVWVKEEEEERAKNKNKATIEH